MASKYVQLGRHAVHVSHTGATSLPGIPPPLGTTTPCVFLHAAGGNAGVWAQQLAACADGGGGLALDFPAHGRSGGTRSLGDVAAHVALVCDLLDWLERPVVLCGAGLGAVVAAHVAAESPGTVQRLVLVGAGLRFDVPSDLTDILHDVVRGRRPQHFGKELFAAATDLDTMKLAWMEQVKTDPRVWLDDLVLLETVDLASVASRVSVPTLLIRGAEDRLVPSEAAAALAACIGGAASETIADGGHQVAIEQATRVSELLTDAAEAVP